MIQVRCGVSRLVVLVGRYAFKIPYPFGWRQFLMGLLANIHETMWKGYSPLLCPIRFSVPGGWLVVMRRATPLTDEEFASLSPDCVTGLPVEFKPSSFGKLGGEVVAVDYGQ